MQMLEWEVETTTMQQSGQLNKPGTQQKVMTMCAVPSCCHSLYLRDPKHP